MSTARRRLKSPRSLSGTSAHPTMVTHEGGQDTSASQISGHGPSNHSPDNAHKTPIWHVSLCFSFGLFDLVVGLASSHKQSGTKPNLVAKN